MALIFPQLQPFTLYASGVNIADTTMTLANFKSIDGVQLTMADFGTKGFMTVEPGAGAQEEQISFSGVTANANGTTTLTGIKTVLFLSPFTETSGFAKQHSGGLIAVVSVTSGVLNSLLNANDDETIAGIYTFTEPNVPRMNLTHSYIAGQELYLATKEYVDSVALAGAPNASTTQKGVAQEATLVQTTAGTTTGSTGARLFVNPGTLITALSTPVITTITYGDTITAGQPVQFNTGTGRWVRANASTSAVFTTFGIALDSGVNGDTGKRVQNGGYITSLSGLTTGYVYVGDTAGLLQSTPGTNSKVIGYATSATTMFILNTLDVPALFGVNSVATTANLNEAMTFFSTTNITGAEAETLTDGSSAGTLHYHPTKVFQSTRDQTAASGAVTYAHGLGYTPKWVRVEVAGILAAVTTTQGHGYYDGTSNKYVGVIGANGSGTAANNIVYYVDLNGSQAGSVTALDATNVTITWTKTATPDAGTLQLQFEVGT